MSKGPEETQRARNRLSYSRCTILETALLHTCNLFLCISLRWEVVHSQCSRLWLSSLTPMTAAVISQQLIWDLLILSAQEERAREGDTGLVCIRRSKEGKKDIGRNRSMRKIKKKKKYIWCSVCSFQISGHYTSQWRQRYQFSIQLLSQTWLLFCFLINSVF